MGRKPASLIAKMLQNFTTKDVYEMWKDMGIVVKDKFGDWVLTEAGKSIGGRMSKNSYHPVPTFEDEDIINKMSEFFEKIKK